MNLLCFQFSWKILETRKTLFSCFISDFFCNRTPSFLCFHCFWEFFEARFEFLLLIFSPIFFWNNFCLFLFLNLLLLCLTWFKLIFQISNQLFSGCSKRLFINDLLTLLNDFFLLKFTTHVISYLSPSILLSSRNIVHSLNQQFNIFRSPTFCSLFLFLSFYLFSFLLFLNQAFLFFSS